MFVEKLGPPEFQQLVEDLLGDTQETEKPRLFNFSSRTVTRSKHLPAGDRYVIGVIDTEVKLHGGRLRRKIGELLLPSFTHDKTIRVTDYQWRGQTRQFMYSPTSDTVKVLPLMGLNSFPKVRNVEPEDLAILNLALGQLETENE